MRSLLPIALALCLLPASSHAGVTINGTTITFDDNSMQSTANPPSDHGGTGSTVSGTDSFVGGGYSNDVTDDFGTISGGFQNTASGYISTVAGGAGHIASGDQSTVSGGSANDASGKIATVSGGSFNSSSGDYGTVGGGDSNLVTDDYGTIGGGQNNRAGDNAGTTSDRSNATVSGGRNNTASGYFSTIAGGGYNTASGYAATVSGGGGYFANVASGGWSTVLGGAFNTASGVTSTASGFANTASGNYSFVAGIGASDNGYANSFVWGGNTGTRISAGVDTFNVWSAGGIYFNGGPVHSVSDRNIKEAFSFVNARAVLDKVLEMPVTTWRFKSESETVRHIGPVAQDFMAAFGYGSSDKHIVGTDADGVTLAAIQGLNEKVESQRADDQAQHAEVITALRWQNAQLQARLARLEKAILRE